nr:hypothetical protein [Tanacetum cinerariifolium]
MGWQWSAGKLILILDATHWNPEAPPQMLPHVRLRCDTMADVNVNALAGQAPAMAPPVRTGDQILPRIRWVPIGKSNCYLDLDKSQSNPIYKIAVDLLKHTNFFGTFTASLTIPSIYIQQPDSPLHLPNEEPVLGYLKFSAKVTKREVFRMPIPGSLITAEIQEASYYQEYLANMAKHRRYLAGETGSDPDSPVTKPTKPARKPKSTAPKAPLRPSVSIPVTSAQPEPTSAPAKTQEKKLKPTTHISGKPSKATKSKYSFVSKKRTPISTLKSVDESVAEAVPTKESQVDADMQRELEESLKIMYDVPRGPLPPVVIREPESGKYQPLLEVPRKGKAKVTEEQVAHDLLSLQKPKKKSPANQYIFQRRTSTPTGSSGHDESSYAELGQSDSEEESKKAGSNLDEQSEGQAGPDPGNAGADEQPMPSLVVHDGSDREHMDLDVADVLPQPSAEQMDEGFTVTTYPKVHQQLKATATDPITTTTTLPPPPYQQQSTAEAMMMKRIGELEHIMSNLIQKNKGLEERLDKHGARLYTLEQLDIPHQVSKAVNEVFTDAVDWAMQAPLQNRFRDLPEADMKEILHQRMWETESYKSHEDHMQLYEALEKSMNGDHSKELAQDLAEARKKKKKRPSRTSRALRASGSSQVPPPPPPPSSTNQESQSKGSAAPSSSKTTASAEYQAWTTTNIRLRPSISLTPVDLQMYEDMAPDEQEQSSNDEDIESAHIPKLWRPTIHILLKTRYSRRPMISPHLWTGSARDEELLSLNLEGPAFEIVKVFHPDVIHLQYQMEECHKILTDSVDDSILRHNVSKPLPLGGPPGQVIIQTDFFFNKDLEYLRYDSKGSRPALSISKMKATYYPDVGLEQMVPDQQRFYIDRHTSEGDRNAVRTHMWILSVVRIEVFSMYVYDYMKKIVLRRADLNEHVIAERDFKYLYPSDFEDMYLLNLQGHLNHLSPKDKKILTTAVNQWTRHLMMMRFNEIHKFSDGTLQQINEALDYRVKEFRINRMNLGLNTRFWTTKDVDRSKAFMFTIQKRLKTRRIFRNLESFIGGRTIVSFLMEFYAFLLTFHSELVDTEKVAVCSSLRSLKPKRTIESRANIKQALGSGFFNSLVHSFRALSTLRRSGLRTTAQLRNPVKEILRNST